MPNTNFQTIHQMGQAINEVVRQATGRDAVQNIDMDHVTVAQNQYYEEVTVSGSMVSFTDRVGNTPLEKCVVQIEPVQDLHGYSKPWAGGAGKNKLKPVKDAGQSTTYGGMTVEFNADGSVSVFGTKDAQDGFKRIPFGTVHLGAGSYIVTGQNLADPSDKLTLQVMNGNTQMYNMSYSTAQSFSFMLTDEADIGVNIGFRDGCSLTSPVKMYPMIRLASVTDDTYEPYSNICPITGWTGVNIHVSPTTDAQDGQTYAITFPAEAGTVYGGTLTVNEDGSGTLVVDRARIQPDTAISSYRGGQNQVIARLAVDAKIFENSTVSSVKCDKIQTVTANWQFQNDANSIAVNSNGQVVLCIKGITEISVMNQWLLNNAIEIVYELATPITYTITTEQIKTLQGQNNIWADTGNIEVTYKDLRGLY